MGRDVFIDIREGGKGSIAIVDCSAKGTPDLLHTGMWNSFEVLHNFVKRHKEFKGDTIHVNTLNQPFENVKE